MMHSYLLYLLCSLPLLLAPTLEASRFPSKPRSHKEVEEIEAKIIEMINEERVKKGLSRLRKWGVLTLYARDHSQNMANKRVGFGHGGFKERAEAVKSEFHWRKFGENVAYSYNMKDPLRTAVKGWMNSPGHRQNILDAFEETGVGVAYSKDGTLYITQLFATRQQTR